MHAGEAESVDRRDGSAAPLRSPQGAGRFSLGDMALGKDPACGIEEHRYPLVVAAEEFEVQVDVHDLHDDFLRRRQRHDESVRFLAQRTATAGEEPHHRIVTIVIASMRPFTAFVLIALLVLLVGAFVFKMQSIGFTP